MNTCGCGCGKIIPEFRRDGKPQRFCNSHSSLWVNKLSMEERFWAKVNMKGPVQLHMKTRCWVWTGFRNKKGYGLFGIGGSGNSKAAHRVSWELKHGSIPNGLHVLHSCDYPPCVRSSHLFIGTEVDNVADRDSKGRQAQKERHSRFRHSKYVVETIRVLRQHRQKYRQISEKLGIPIGSVHMLLRRGW